MYTGIPAHLQRGRPSDLKSGPSYMDASSLQSRFLLLTTLRFIAFPALGLGEREDAHVEEENGNFDKSIQYAAEDLQKEKITAETVPANEGRSGSR